MDEVIRLLNEAGVRYLLIGGQAVRLEGMPVRCLCRADLIWSKKAAHRPQDEGDIAFLEALE